MRVWASETKEPRSRPRTLHWTTTRRLAFSRVIWLMPSVSSMRATEPRGTKPTVGLGVSALAAPGVAGEV